MPQSTGKPMVSDPLAVLITGVYGTGKTTTAEAISNILAEIDAPLAAIDLDWLIWANIEGGHGAEAQRVLLQNLGAVVANYRAAGITRFVLAGWVERAADIDGMRHALDMPLQVVRLTAPIAVVEHRLGASGPDSADRQEELDRAREALLSGEEERIGDLVVDATQPGRAVANEIIDWLGWRSGSS